MLPATQAGLMALMAEGIVGGEMAWPLVVAGMFLAGGLILINAPSPMLIAVGMYLPFQSTAAIFVGGMISWMLARALAKRGASEEAKTRAVNTGVLLSSGFIAGQALMAVLLALPELGRDRFDWIPDLPLVAERIVGPEFVGQWGAWFGALVFVLLVYMLVNVPLREMQKRGADRGEM